MLTSVLHLYLECLGAWNFIPLCPLPFGKHTNVSRQEDKKQEDLLYLSDTDVELIT